MSVSRYTKTRSHGTLTSSNQIRASFSSKRDDSGLSAADTAAASKDLRDRIFSPGVATGTAKEIARSSSPGRSGCRLATNSSLARIVAVPSILAPRTVMPALSSSTRRGDQVRLLLAPGFAAVGLRVDDDVAEVEVVAR